MMPGTLKYVRDLSNGNVNSVTILSGAETVISVITILWGCGKVWIY